MTIAANKRLYAVLMVSVLFVGYVCIRDTIRVEAGVSAPEAMEMIGMAQEWSAPKFFRHIQVRQAKEGRVAVWIREPKNSWSVTVFSDISGSWKKESWYLAEEDKVKLNVQ